MNDQARLSARSTVPRFLNIVLQQRNGVEQLLRTRRTAGDMDVHRNDLINALHRA